MQIIEVLNKLRKYAKDFELVGDANKYIKTNKEDFISKWAKLNQYYNYVLSNTEELSDEWFEAVEIINDLALANPSLDTWLEMIIDPRNEKIKTSNQVTYMDTSALSGRIENLVNEIERMQHWDQEYVEFVGWQLQECQIKLIQNQSAFETSVYHSLMNDITASLEKIGIFNNMIDSDLIVGMGSR